MDINVIIVLQLEVENMRLIFDEKLGRVFSRKSALGFKTLEIAEDIQRGDSVTVEFKDNKILLVKDESTVEGDEPIYAFLTKEIGVYGGTELSTSIDVILCDDVMLVLLFDGSIAIRPEGNLMAASRGVSKLPTCRADNINWLSVLQLLSYCSNIGTYSGKYPYDYEYPLKVQGGVVSGLKQIRVGKFNDLQDISNGNFTRIEEEKKKREDAKEAANIAKTMFGFNNQNSYEVDDTDDDYDDDDYDDDDY